MGNWQAGSAAARGRLACGLGVGGTVLCPGRHGWGARSEVGVLPAEWGLVVRSVCEVQRSLAGAEAKPKAKPQPSAPDAVLAYVARERKNLLSLGNLTEPLSTAEFAKVAGFLRKVAGRTELLVPAGRFQREFPDPVALMRELRAVGLARTERGDRPKLTIKAPGAICGTGRVYCVVIGTATA